jgi:cysteine desulfurase
MPPIVERLRSLSPFNSDAAEWLQDRQEAVIIK